MLQVATFEKVSFEQYCKDMSVEPNEYFRNEWEAIRLPTRATPGSAGYDFYFPQNPILINKDHGYIIPTGIRVRLDPGWALILLPRSSFGIKYGMRLSNTVGLIDSDYYGAANEGHIMAKVSSKEAMALRTGDRFMQGVLLCVGLATNDTVVSETRVGGFGSTGA